MPEVTPHHPVFDAFRPFEGTAEPGFEISFFGVALRDWLFTGTSKGLNSRRDITVGYPPPDEEYFEWIALLAAVATAKASFNMFELGAGWGRWSLYATKLCEQRGLPVRICAVEPEPTHFEWMRMAFEDNGLKCAEHDLYQAAISSDRSPVHLAGPDDPKRQYGHYVPSGLHGWIRGLLQRHQVRKVSAVSLAGLLETCAAVDFIDMDIQGMEARVLAPVTAEMLRRVRVIHVGTHSHEVEAEIKETFARVGWINAFSFACGSTAETPYGAITFQDGVETWVNPHATDALEAMRRSGPALEAAH